ncbi:MAG TPA: lipoate--protein ligase family protein [Gemmatimonadaceae bacterium]
MAALAQQRIGASAGELSMLRWRVLLTEPFSGAENMALDDALMERARRTGEAVLRVYGWRRPTLSLGRNQWAAGRYDVERAAALGVDIVRRPTGGRAVLHDHEVTYSVTAPASGLGTLRESYARLNRLVLDALRRLGVNAQEARRTAVPPAPGIAPCFETPVAGEITADGRKLVGSAQFRERDALLQHGSILVEDDQWLATSLLIAPVAPAPSAATLHALLGRVPELREVMQAFTEALRAAGGHDLAPLEADILLDEDARRARARYEDPHWTWRR